MATPQLTPEQIAQLSALVAEYIGAQRHRFPPQAAPLAAAQRAAMDGFFPPQLLDAARVLVLRGVRVENPPFYPLLVGKGFSNLPDFSQMAAITFCDWSHRTCRLRTRCCSMNSCMSSSTASLGFRASLSYMCAGS